MNTTSQNSKPRGQLRPLSIAPMMDRTDRHYRSFMRMLTRRTLLYTEMITSGAIIHGDRDHLLGFSDVEHPLALQIGGSEPSEMAKCARIAEDRGYDEVNINVGCPSDRVQRGRFGACLMLEPQTVADCVSAMRNATTLPVTVKHRIGVDDTDSYADMANFVRIVSSAGCRHFSIHARKAWLQGLSPKENRNVPPLRYHEIYRLKDEFPTLRIEINGGVKTLSEIEDHLERVDAVMIGRAAYDNPYLFARVDRQVFGEEVSPVERHDAVLGWLPEVERQLSAGTRLHRMTRHILHLFRDQPGSRRWRRHLTVESVKDGAGIEVLEDALEMVPRPEMKDAA